MIYWSETEGGQSRARQSCNLVLDGAVADVFQIIIFVIRQGEVCIKSSWWSFKNEAVSLATLTESPHRLFTNLFRFRASWRAV